MTCTCTDVIQEQEERSKNSYFLRWGKLIFGLAMIWVFVFVIAPWLQRMPYIAEVHETVRQSGIDATALVYTENPIFGDADVHIRDAMKY